MYISLVETTKKSFKYNSPHVKIGNWPSWAKISELWQPLENFLSQICRLSRLGQLSRSRMHPPGSAKAYPHTRTYIVDISSATISHSHSTKETVLNSLIMRTRSNFKS